MSKFQKRHYEVVAAGLAEAYNAPASSAEADFEQKVGVIRAMNCIANRLAADNERFDTQKFFEAVVGEENVEKIEEAA